MAVAMLRRARSRALVGTALAILFSGAAHAQSLPVGGTVVSGTASIASNGTATTVTQTSGRAIVDWTSFNVDVGKTVTFVQPNVHSATLNRVTGATSSSISGVISSNGAVYLVNPNGIVINSSGWVQTAGGFVASTLAISDADFNAGRLNFTGNGASKSVVNRGMINVAGGAGAYVALLGGSVSNVGSIIVPLGKVGLGSGEQATLDLNGDGFMQVAIPSAGTGTAVDMTGRITATGGRVELKAASVRDAVRNVVNLSGVINVDNAVGDGGAIVLLGGDGGTVTAKGTLSARATGANGKGGLVETSGEHINFAGLKVDTTAAHGKTGTWLVDPTDLTVDAAAASTISTNLGSSNVTLQTNADGTTSGPGNTSAGNGDININSAISWSSANTLALTAYNNVNLNAQITGTSGTATLTSASGSVNLNAGLSAATVNLVGPVILMADTSLTGGLVHFSQSVDGAHALSIAGNARFDNSVGATTRLTSLFVSGSSALNGGDVSTTGAQVYSGGGSLGSDTTLAGGTVQFGNALDGAHQLSITGDATFSGAVGATTALTSIQVSGTAALDANVSTTGGQSYSGAVFVGANETLAGSLIHFAQTVDGAHALAIVGGAQFDASVGGSTPLSSLSVSGTSTLNGGTVTTSGSQTYTGGGTLGSNATLAGSTVEFDGALNGAYSLAITGNGLIKGALGATTQLSSVHVSGSTTLDANVTTTGAQTYVGAVTVGGASSLAGATLSFGSTITASADLTLSGSALTLGDDLSSSAALHLNLGSASISSTHAVGVATFDLQSGNWVQSAASLPSFSATDFRINVSSSSFLRVTGGDGTSGTPYQVADVYGLQGMASSTLLAKNFALANSIDASGTANWNAGRGFVPIGTDGNSGIWTGTFFSTSSGIMKGYTGSFNGNGYVLTDLNIARSFQGYLGLFGYATTGTLSNVTLAGGSISGGGAIGALLGSGSSTVTGASSSADVTAIFNFAGGLIGSTTGSVSGSSASGTVHGGTNVGGLIGIIKGGSVAGSHATGTVVASDNYVGGLIGYASDSSVTQSWASGSVTAPFETGGLIGEFHGTTLDQTYASGAVNGSSEGVVGGLVGSFTSGSISRSYATGSVTAGSNAVAGGLAGRSYGDITQAYATGAVTAATAGGLVGTQYSGTIANSVYWDSFSTGLSGAIGSVVSGTSSATSVTSDPSQSAAANYAFKASAYSNFTGSDWVYFDGQTRPFGAWEAVAGGGSIVNSHQLQLIGRADATALSSNYSLGADISLAETGANHGTAATSAGMWAATGWVPIGTDGAGNRWNGSSFTGSGTTGYSGSFNGNGHSLTNLGISRASANYVGLFGYTGTGTISNVTLSLGSVSGAGWTGALVGYETFGGTVSAASSSVNVTGAGSNVGGLVGYAAGAISGSSASGNVTNSGQNTGGLAGTGGIVTNSSASGTVIGTSGTGGLIGFMLTNATVSNLSASGAVTGTVEVGGLIGHAALDHISNAYATGSVNGTNYVGGLIGNIQISTIDRTWASGSATATADGGYAGGLLGLGAGGDTVSRSYATGSVTESGAGGFAGGLIGYNSASVTQGYASGKVTAANAGGVAGYTDGTVASSVYWDSFSTGQSAGYSTASGGTFSGATVTSDPTQSAASNYAYKAGAYGNLTASDWVFFDGQTRPFAAWEVPTTTIANSHQLQLIGANAATLSGSFTISSNINLAETGANLGTAATSAGMWSSAGFVPLGTDGKGNVWDGSTYKLISAISSGTYGFTGSLNGGGYTLSNLGISRSGVAQVGLFGVSSGNLSRIALGGTVAGGSNTGGLVGLLTSGTVTGSSSAVNVSGATLVGGLAGNQVAGATISLSSASGSVSGTDDVGGLVGYSAGSISLSYATGSASGAHYVGGLVGYDYHGSVTNSYAAGSASATINAAGGLIGKLDTASVTNSYSIGPVTGLNNGGGLIGMANAGTITNSYWNTTTSGKSTSAGGTGKTTTELQTSGTFAGWDFTSIWKISGGYPVLIGNP